MSNTVVLLREAYNVSNKINKANSKKRINGTVQNKYVRKSPGGNVRNIIPKSTKAFFFFQLLQIFDTINTLKQDEVITNQEKKTPKMSDVTIYYCPSGIL